MNAVEWNIMMNAVDDFNQRNAVVETKA